MSRLTSLSSMLAVAVALSALSAGSAAGTSRAFYASCSIRGHERDYGTTYVNSPIKVHGASCTTAKGVVRAFHRCRREHGLRGHCNREVKGYRCTETRPAAETIPTQYNGHVTCRRGSARIKHTYQQNT